MRFLKFVIFVVLVYANLDILSQWTTEKSYTNVGSFNNLNIEYKVNKQYNNSVISCIGEADGEIAVIISGGTPPYSVIWGGDLTPSVTTNNVISSDTIRNLPRGSYRISIRDSGPGLGSNTIFEPAENHTIVLSDPPKFQLYDDPLYNGFDINHEKNAPTCSDSLDGSIRAAYNGGSGALSYLWDNGDSTVSNPAIGFVGFADSLGKGLHSLRITDANGCFKDTTFEIDLPLPIFPNVVISHPGCAGDNNGILTAVPSGGTGSFTDYTWDDPANQTTAAASNLSPGTYKVIVKDSDGCQGDTSVTVSAASAIIINLIQDPVQCFGAKMVQLQVQLVEAPLLFLAAINIYGTMHLLRLPL